MIKSFLKCPTIHPAEALEKVCLQCQPKIKNKIQNQTPATVLKWSKASIKWCEMPNQDSTQV